MTRKPLDHNHRIAFNHDPNTPSFGSVIPEMSCLEVAERVASFRESGTIRLGIASMVAKHLSDHDEVAHSSECPIYQRDVAKMIKQRLDSAIS